MLRVSLILSTIFLFNVFNLVSSITTLRNNNLILPSLPYCGLYTISKPCGDPCQKVCGQPKPTYCTQGCIINGCVCLPGYVRRDENGPCIPESWCKLATEPRAVDEPLHFRIYDH